MAVLLANIRGLMSNFDELKITIALADEAPDLVILTETFLSTAVPDSAIQISGYDTLRRDRPTHGGGVVVYCKKLA